MIFRYYVLECDACETPMGMSSDPSHPSRGITICSGCWRRPEELPRHLQATLAYEQAQQ